MVLLSFHLDFVRKQATDLAVQTTDFDYFLPPELIAQIPTVQREEARLLVLDRLTGNTTHRQFPDLIHYLAHGDVVVLNDSKVIPARLRGEKSGSGGQIEILLLTEMAPNQWWAMLRPGKRVRPGTQISFRGRSGQTLEAEVLEKNEHGQVRLLFSREVRSVLDEFGEVPLPPYIARDPQNPTVEDRDRYQTVFARHDGSVAAPTAGLHFSNPFLQRLRSAGVTVCFVTLHVGLGTFAPVKSRRIENHVMHDERFELPRETAEAIIAAKNRGNQVLAAGTTTVRVLESMAADKGELTACAGRTRIFIYPPFKFKIVDRLLTNFHLPQSTLLMLVSAFAAPGQQEGRKMILRAYREAVRERYRFFSYGDAMLIL